MFGLVTIEVTDLLRLIQAWIKASKSFGNSTLLTWANMIHQLLSTSFWIKQARVNWHILVILRAQLRFLLVPVYYLNTIKKKLIFLSLSPQLPAHTTLKLIHCKNRHLFGDQSNLQPRNLEFTTLSEWIGGKKRLHFFYVLGSKEFVKEWFKLLQMPIHLLTTCPDLMYLWAISLPAHHTKTLYCGHKILRSQTSTNLTTEKRKI